MANVNLSMPCHVGFSRSSSWCVLLHCATLIQEHFWDAQKAQEEGSEQRVCFDTHGKIHVNIFFLFNNFIYLRELSAAQIYRKGGWCVHQYKGAPVLSIPVLYLRTALWSLGWHYCSLSDKPGMWEAEECSPAAVHEAVSARGCCICRTASADTQRWWRSLCLSPWNAWAVPWPDRGVGREDSAGMCSIWLGGWLFFSVQLELVSGTNPKVLSWSFILLIFSVKGIFFWAVQYIGHHVESSCPKLSKWLAELWQMLGTTLKQCSWY